MSAVGWLAKSQFGVCSCLCEVNVFEKGPLSTSNGNRVPCAMVDGHARSRSRLTCINPKLKVVVFFMLVEIEIELWNLMISDPGLVFQGRSEGRSPSIP
jgi:prepilin-type processing-associated H-X9-DG protein